jgi:hypothetical protein
MEVREGTTMAQYAKMLLDGVGIKTGVISVEDGRGAEFDEYVLRVDGYIEVYEGETEISSILGTKKVPGFDIGRVRHYSNYPHEPDEWDWNPDENCRSVHRAVEMAVEMALTDGVKSVAESIGTGWWSDDLHEHGERY